MASAGEPRSVVLAVTDPVSVSVDEPGVGDVLADVDDRHLVAGACQDVVPGADRGHDAVLDEEGLRDGRIVHRQDPPDEDEAPGRSCRRIEASGVGAAVLAGGESAAGELALLASQPPTRTSITRTASLRAFGAAPEAITPVTALEGPDLFDLR